MGQASGQQSPCRVFGSTGAGHGHISSSLVPASSVTLTGQLSSTGTHCSCPPAGVSWHLLPLLAAASPLGSLAGGCPGAGGGCLLSHSLPEAKHSRFRASATASSCSSAQPHHSLQPTLTSGGAAAVVPCAHHLTRQTSPWQPGQRAQHTRTKVTALSSGWGQKLSPCLTPARERAPAQGPSIPKLPDRVMFNPIKLYW